MIENARWADADKAGITCTLDGVPGAFIPAGHYLLDGFEGEIADYVAPEDAPLPVPASVEIWQFAWQAAAEKIIDMKEARAWSGRGVLPATLETKLADVVADPDQREGLAMQLESLTTVTRADPLVGTLGALFGKDGPALDAFFRAAEQRGATGV